MTISNTYLGMQEQIADELGDRQDLLTALSDSGLALSPIQIAIQSAIARFERRTFYFNAFLLQTGPSGPYAWSTVASQEYYGAADYAPIPLLASISKLWVLLNGNRYPCTARTPGYMDEVSINPSVSGMPSDYSYEAEQLRFYPIPDGIYPVGIFGTQRLSALVNPTDANAWTQDAFDLIRSQAKQILARGTLRDDALSAAMQRDIYGDPEEPESRGFLFDLTSETTRRLSRSRIRPSNF